MTAICHWEVSLTLIHFKDDDFTVMLLRKRQRSLNVDDADLNVERRKSE